MVTLRELVDNPSKINALRVPADKCYVCHGPIEEHPDEPGYRISGKRVCGDCYYDGIGKLIEKHPIACARVRRG
jgi:hypothetical protein